MKVGDFEGDLAGLLDEYDYQPSLTTRLDELRPLDPFTQAVVNEITLWKVDRYVDVPPELLRRLGKVSEVPPREHRRAADILKSLLDVHGVDLPMASTFLRFRCPAAFQILDRHAFRALYGEVYSLDSLQRATPALKVRGYFRYLEDLWAQCDARDWEFRMIDRALYEFDRQMNGALPKRGTITWAVWLDRPSRETRPAADRSDLVERWIRPNPNKPGAPESWVLPRHVSVWAIIRQLEIEGWDTTAVADFYGLPPEAVRAAAAYYDLHRATVDERIKTNRAYFAAL